MSSIKPALTLLAVTTVSALLLGILYNITREPIMQQQITRQREIIADLLPGTVQTHEEVIDNHPALIKFVAGYNLNGELIGYTVRASSPGCGGPVEIMAGFDMYGRLTGVRILHQRETPGLGTAIQNPSFLNQFAGRTETMTVTRIPTTNNEIAALASATISTEAVVNGVNAAIEYIRGRLN